MTWVGALQASLLRTPLHVPMGVTCRSHSGPRADCSMAQDRDPIIPFLHVGLFFLSE